MMLPIATLVSQLIPIAAVAVVLILLGIGIGYSRKLTARLRSVKAALIQRFGFTDKNPKGLVPDLFGEVCGLTTAVDVVYLRYSHPEGISPLHGLSPG